MARFELDRKGIGEYLRTSRELGRGCERIAEHEARELIARTPVEEGETRASTRAERAFYGDRQGAVVVQEYAAVTLEWGNDRVAAQHHASRGH